MLRTARNVFPLSIALVILCAQPAAAQDNPVYVYDSPRAWQQFRQAVDQSAENLGEAVRLLQELLDEDHSRILPISEADPAHFVSVRARVNATLSANADLLDRYRQIESARAEQLLERDEIDRLVITRSLTTSGLEGLLRLAQRELEAGRFHAALDWLEEARSHDLLNNERDQHVALMQAIAWQHLAEPAHRDEAQARAGDLAARAAEALGDPPPAPSLASGRTVLDRTPTLDLFDLVSEDIWSVRLSETLVSRAANATDSQGGADDPVLRAVAPLRQDETPWRPLLPQVLCSSAKAIAFEPLTDTPGVNCGGILIGRVCPLPAGVTIRSTSTSLQWMETGSSHSPVTHTPTPAPLKARSSASMHRLDAGSGRAPSTP